MTSVGVTLAFDHSDIGKRQKLTRISQCILMQPFAKQSLHVIGKEFHLVSNISDTSTYLTHSPPYGYEPIRAAFSLT